MKDIQYFLYEEEKYLASPQTNPELVWNDEYGEFDYPYDPLSFSKKNTTRRAGDFSREQEARPCFPVKSRNYLCAQNGNDCLIRLTERRENGGKQK